jgi:hypothetical protein
MDWLEKDQETNRISKADAERSQLLNEVKKGSLPTIQKEADNGAPPFKEMKFQPVKSPGIYEAEFGVKGKDLLFHFWPWGYHAADANGQATPKFSADFLPKLKKIMGETFDAKRIEVKDDADVGALFVKASSWADNEFHRELAVKACEALHKAMGGKPG